MQKTRRFRALAVSSSLLFLIALLVSACGGSTGTPTSSTTKAADNKQVFVSTAAGGGQADISTFDPALITDALSATPANDVFTGLVSLDDNGNVQPQLASSWTVSPDHLTYTFTIKPNLKFSNGDPLTADSIAWSINRALAPATGSTTAPYYQRYIKDATAFNSGKIKTLIGDSLIVKDPTTLVIVASQPIAFFLATLTYTSALVINEKVVDKYPKNWTDHLDEGAGSGPFMVKQWAHNKEIDLVPNPNYYGVKPQLKEIRYPFYQKADDTYGDYMAGKLDDTGVPVANMDQAQSRPDFHKNLILAISYYTMNYNQKPFDNVKIRQAFALSINKQQITSKIWKNTMLPTNHIVPQGQPGYYDGLKGPDNTDGVSGNPTLAKQLLQQGLQEEGWSSVKQMPQVTLTYSSGGAQSVKDEVSQMLQEWNDVLGVHVNASDIDIRLLFKDEGLGTANPLQFYTGPAWIADYPDASDWTTLQFAAGAAQNGMNYGQNKGSGAAAQQANQKLLEQADIETDPAKRLADYNKAEQQLVNDVAWMPMEQQYAVGLRKPCVQGVIPNAQGITPPDDWGKIYISTGTCANATVS